MEAFIIPLYGFMAFLGGWLMAKAFYKNHSQPGEYHNGNTMTKVILALRASGLTESQSRIAIGYMQNRGILFRESVKPKSVIQTDSDSGIGKGSVG